MNVTPYTISFEPRKEKQPVIKTHETFVGSSTAKNYNFDSTPFHRFLLSWKFPSKTPWKTPDGCPHNAPKAAKLFICENFVLISRDGSAAKEKRPRNAFPAEYSQLTADPRNTNLFSRWCNEP